MFRAFPSSLPHGAWVWAALLSYYACNPTFDVLLHLSFYGKTIASEKEPYQDFLGVTWNSYGLWL